MDGSDSTGPEPVSTGDPEISRRRWRLVMFAVAAVVLVVDQLTKLWAETALVGRAPAPVPVLGDVIQFRLVYNTGAAFSIGSGSTWILTIVAATAVVVLVWYGRKVGSAGWAVALGLVLGGASTHLLDRLFRSPGFGRGHVVDFIDYGWFVGNVADIALVTGVGLLLLLSLVGPALDGSRPKPPDA